ncbi:MAG: LptA/OstA family protein [Candidatus Poribacteria bacterium]
MKRIYITFVLVFCLTVISVFSATEENMVYYNYSAKSMILNKKEGYTVLKGNVKATKLDAQKKETGEYVNSDQLTIYFKRDEKTGELTDEVIRTEAMGNVKMKQGEMTITCLRAVMIYEPEEVINMEGSKESPAIADDGKNRIEAPTIKYFRKDDRLEAEGDVTGQITIKEKKSEENKEESKEKTGK